MILSVTNNLDVKSQYSYTAANVITGAGTIPVKNINAFSANHAIQIGKTGEEQTEIILLNSSAPSGTSIVSSGTTRFNHPLDTPIFDINFNQIIFKRSTIGTAGTAAAFATVNITPDSQYTQYNDTTGASTYAYKTQYNNSASGEQSSNSAWFIPGGPSFYSLAKLRQRSKDNLFSAGYIKYDSVIDDWINEWYVDWTNAAIKVNQGYSQGTVAYSFGTAGYGTITAADFKQPKKVEISYDGGNSWTQSKEITIQSFSDSDIYTSVYPCHYWYSDNVIGIRPASTGGSVKLTYGKIPSLLTADSDELPLSLRAYTVGCMHWVLYRAYDNDQKSEYAEPHYQKYLVDKGIFIGEITPRDMTGPKTIQFDETLSGRADDYDLEYFAT